MFKDYAWIFIAVLLEVIASIMLFYKNKNNMNSKDTNRVNMIDSTTGYCDLNTAATAGIPAFSTTITAIKAKMVLVNGLNQIGAGTSKGVTTDTNLLRKTMSDLAMKCASATLGYANSVHNNTLKALVNFTRSKLDALKKEDVDDVCQGIHDATNTNIVVVTPFGANAGDVTDLQAAIDLYRTGTQNPRQAIIGKSQAIKQAKEMVREVIDDLLIGQLDVMTNTLQFSNKDFWNGYHQAREIIDLGSTSAKVRGTVLDENDVPLKNVLFTILKTGTDVKVTEVATDVKGKFIAAKLLPGDFDFKWELNGYKTVSEMNVHIAAGKELKRKIVMYELIIRYGDLAANAITNIDISGIDGKNIDLITVQVIGSAMKFYGSNTANAAPGVVFLEVAAGQTLVKTANEFGTAAGIGNGSNDYLNVQNSGGGQGHFTLWIELK